MQEPVSGRMRPPSQATQAFIETGRRLRVAMQISYARDADHDYATLVALYDAAVTELAQTVLAHGTDPTIRTLAENVMAVNQRRATDLAAWRASHP